MDGEDFAYGGAGSASDVKKPAVVAGEVKKTSHISSTKMPMEKTPAKGIANEADWGQRNEGQQVPGGMPESERAGTRSTSSK